MVLNSSDFLKCMFPIIQKRMGPIMKILLLFERVYLLPMWSHGHHDLRELAIEVSYTILYRNNYLKVQDRGMLFLNEIITVQF